MIDLTKLPPAPFAVRPCEFDSWGWVRDATGGMVGTFDVARYCNDFDRTADPDRKGPPEVQLLAEFFALARNALDVMLRRGWWAVPVGDVGRWAWRVRVEYGYDPKLEYLVEDPSRGYFADPFTALVKYDAWLTAREAATP